MPLAVRLAARHLSDNLVQVHAHHGIGVDQLPELGEHGMEHDLLAPALRPLAVAVEPRLQIVLVLRQPTGPAPDVHGMRMSRHAGNYRRLPHLVAPSDPGCAAAPPASRSRRAPAGGLRADTDGYDHRASPRVKPAPGDAPRGSQSAAPVPSSPFTRRPASRKGLRTSPGGELAQVECARLAAQAPPRSSVWQ